MARTLAAGELFRRVTHFFVTRIQTGTIGDTTTTAPVTGAGAETTVAVTGITNFTAADPCLIIGDGGVERVVIGTPNTTMPATPPPRIPQSTGARFVEAVDLTPGKIAPDSLQFGMTKSLTAVFEEIGDAPVVYLPGNIEFEMSFGLLSVNGLNLQLLAGYIEEETGTGSSITVPTQSVLGLVNQATSTEQVVTLRGIRHDAKNFQIELCNAYIEVAVAATFAKSAPTVLNGKFKASAIKAMQWT
jgi:hypothetical protein